MKRFLDIVLFRRCRQGDAVSDRVSKASASQAEASKSLIDSIKDILSEHDRHKVSPVLVRKR